MMKDGDDDDDDDDVSDADNGKALFLNSVNIIGMSVD